MQEFSSISVSSYEPDSLTAQLNEQSAAGWDVVAILPTGSTITAYLARESSGQAETEDAIATPEPVIVDPEPEAVAEEPVIEEPVIEEPVIEEPVVEEPAPADDHFVVATDPVPEPAPEPTVEPAPEPAAEPAAAAAPAGWYADPSSRFELRYWDGTTWTEHVSRGGQQFTDPPVA